MNILSWLIWGFVSTIVLTTLLAGSQGLKWTRMNIPYMLGTMITPNRDRAKIIGIFFHLFNGFVFSLIYIGVFTALHEFHWYIGAILGFIHALFMLAVGLPALPGMHPRMAGEQSGPTVTRQLEPPGFFCLNYGMQTPLSIIIAHVVFGIILGTFYSPN